MQGDFTKFLEKSFQNENRSHIRVHNTFLINIINRRWSPLKEQEMFYVFLPYTKPWDSWFNNYNKTKSKTVSILPFRKFSDAEKVNVKFEPTNLYNVPDDKFIVKNGYTKRGSRDDNNKNSINMPDITTKRGPYSNKKSIYLEPNNFYCNTKEIDVKDTKVYKPLYSFQHTDAEYKQNEATDKSYITNQELCFEEKTKDFNPNFYLSIEKQNEARDKSCITNQELHSKQKTEDFKPNFYQSIEKLVKKDTDMPTDQFQYTTTQEQNDLKEKLDIIKQEPNSKEKMNFKLNFYRSIEEVDQKDTETSKPVDEFQYIRPYIHKKWIISQYETKSSDFICCKPCIISLVINYCLKLYTAKKYNSNVHDAEYIKHILFVKKHLSRIVNYDSSRSDIWNEIDNVVCITSNFHPTIIIYAILDIILDEQYLKIPLPLNYIKLILFVISLDAKKKFLHYLYQHIRKMLLLKRDTALKVTDIILLTKFYAMMRTFEQNASDLIDLIYNALSRLKYSSHPMIICILSVWPLVFPPSTASNDLLMYTMAWAILNHDMKRNNLMFQVTFLKNLLKEQYQYRHGRVTAEMVLQMLMGKISNKTWELSILLLGKRKGAEWMHYFFLVRYLFPIIRLWKIERQIPDLVIIKCINVLGSMYIVISEIENVYPLKSCLEIFSDLLFNYESNYKIQEAIIVQLWNLSQIMFFPCLDIIIKWKPENGLVSKQLFLSIDRSVLKLINSNINPAWIYKLHRLKKCSNDNMKKFIAKNSAEFMNNYSQNRSDFVKKKQIEKNRFKRNKRKKCEKLNKDVGTNMQDNLNYQDKNKIKQKLDSHLEDKEIAKSNILDSNQEINVDAYNVVRLEDIQDKGIGNTKSQISKIFNADSSGKFDEQYKSFQKNETVMFESRKRKEKVVPIGQYEPKDSDAQNITSNFSNLNAMMLQNFQRKSTKYSANCTEESFKKRKMCA